MFLNRKNRWENWDYNERGYYFITIVTKNRICWFDKYGKIAFDCWNDIPDHFPECKLDEFVMMPNHFHDRVIRNDWEEFLIKRYIKNNPRNWNKDSLAA
jgi:hypothetical protein